MFFFKRRRSYGYPSARMGGFGGFMANPWARIGLSVFSGLLARRAYTRRRW